MTIKRTFLVSLLLISGIGMGVAQDLQQQLQAVKENIRQIRTVKYTIDYMMTVRSGSIVDFEETTTDTKGKKSSVVYRINVADIDPMRLETGIQSNMMKLEVHTIHDRELIAEIKEGEINRYLKGFKFDVEDNDQARVLIEALTEAAATAKKIENGKYGYSSLEEILADLTQAVGKVGSDVTMQKISYVSDIKGKLSHEIQKEKGAVMKYEFNLKDLNINELNFEARGTNLSVEFKTNAKEKVIKVFESGLAKTFDYKGSIVATDVENGKHILRLMEMAIRVINGASLATLSSGNGATGLAKFSFQSAMQSGKKIPTPDFANKPCWTNVSEPSINNFEKNEYSTQAKATFGGARGLIFIPGLHSPIRFSGSSKVLAVISTGGLDPSDIVALYRFTQNQGKDRREYTTTKGNIIGTSVEVEKVSVPVSFKPLGNGLFIIVPDSPLAPGEYVYGTEKSGYAFGVD